MKLSSLLPSAAGVCLSIAVLTAVAVAQAPQNPHQGDGMPGMQSSPQAGGPPRAPGNEHFPPPKHLKVLPKNLTGAQVRDIMHGWAGDLGVGCDKCHAEFPDHRKGANGRPELDFPSDAKPEKKMARVMYKMFEVDKNDYVTKVAAMDKSQKPAPPLTCGTCHRGHFVPEPTCRRSVKNVVSAPGERRKPAPRLFRRQETELSRFVIRGHLWGLQNRDPREPARCTV